MGVEAFQKENHLKCYLRKSIGNYKRTALAQRNDSLLTIAASISRFLSEVKLNVKKEVFSCLRIFRVFLFFFFFLMFKWDRIKILRVAEGKKGPRHSQQV